MARPAVPDGFRTLPVAHRALHDAAAGRPENSLAAIRAAIAHGYAIETDVQLSADGRVMVFHDDTLERLTPQTGPVKARTAAELTALPLMGSSETIPTLAQVLAEIAGRVPLLVEIKDQSLNLGPLEGELERAVAADIAGYAGPLALMSFNPHSMAHMAQLAPSVPRGLTTCSYTEDWWDELAPGERERLNGIPDFDPVEASFISHEWRDLANPRVAELKAAGALILSWTLRSAADEAVARRNADNVTFEGYLAALPAARP